MTPTPEPATRQSPTKWTWIFVIVLGVAALGLNLLAFVHKPKPWPEALGSPLVVGGMMLLAWANLLPAAKTGARRILMGLCLVCTLAGLVLATLDYIHVFRP